MIIAEVQQYIEGRVRGDVIYPCYESFSLAKIPSTILALLGVSSTSESHRLTVEELAPYTSAVAVVK